MHAAQPGLLVVCEGVPDALIASQAGFRSVALIGTWAADRAIGARLAIEADDDVELVTVFDADAAGRDAAIRLDAHVAEHGHRTRIMAPPMDGWDLNDWARHDPGWADEVVDALHPGAPAAEALTAGVDIEL